MGESTIRPVRRERLLSQLVASRVAVVEAPAGFGKSVLASQLRQELGIATAYVQLDRADAEPVMFVATVRRALRAARLSDLAAATGSDSAVDPAAAIELLLDALVEVETELLLVFDDAHRLGDDAGAILMRLVRGLPARHRLLISARRLVGELALAARVDGALELDTGQLAFTADEAADLLLALGVERHGGDELSLLVQETHGWATAIVLAAKSGVVAPVLARSRPDLIAAPLRRILEPLSDKWRRTLVWLAHLPLNSAELCDALAGERDTLARLIDAGVPLMRTSSGWWEMPGPVADLLAARERLAGSAAQVAAELYARDGELIAALRVLLGAGLAEPAAALLERSGARGVNELGFAAHRELLEGLPDEALREHPRLLLDLARVAEATHEAAVRARALERAARLLEQGGGGAAVSLQLELDAELAREQMWDGRTRARAGELAAAVLDNAVPDDLVARTRALDVLGRMGAWWSEVGPRPEAEQLLLEAARLARRAGQPTWAAQALVPLAVGCHIGNCRYERAVAVLDEALSDLPARGPYRANVLSFRAEALIELGRYREADACLAQIRALGRLERQPWMFAYASWSDADMASRQGDRAGTVEAVLEVERHRDAWFEQPSGVEFLAQAADYLDRAGEHPLAREYLRRARERCAGVERDVGIYEAFVLGRSGDPAEGRHATEAMLAGPAADPHQRWPMLVLRAFAALRNGDPDAGRLAAEAFDTCLELGHPDGPLLREPAAAEALLPHAAAAGSRAAAQLLERGGTLQIRLLGEFEIRRAGRLVEPPPGRPAKAVRAVAAAGGRMHAEELSELLWPRAPADLGRNRMRNLLSRLRSATGELLVRDGELVALPAGSEVDADSFAVDSGAALAARAGGEGQRAEVLARAALARYGGELLPEDRYEEWAARPRERLRSRYLELLELLAAAAEQGGEVDEAARLLERAIEVEPYDEPHYLRLASLRASQGRIGTALSILRRARMAQAELGRELSADLRELELRLRGRRRAV